MSEHPGSDARAAQDFPGSSMRDVQIALAALYITGSAWQLGTAKGVHECIVRPRIEADSCRLRVARADTAFTVLTGERNMAFETVLELGSESYSLFATSGVFETV